MGRTARTKSMNGTTMSAPARAYAGTARAFVERIPKSSRCQPSLDATAALGSRIVAGGGDGRTGSALWGVDLGSRGRHLHLIVRPAAGDRTRFFRARNSHLVSRIHASRLHVQRRLREELRVA